MKFINFCILQVFMLSVVSCSANEEASQLLSTYLQNGIYKNSAVIACSASDVISGDVLTFFHPNAGATKFRLFETNSVKENPNIFSNYKRVNLEREPFFNGYLQKFTQKATSEKWIIVTFQLDNEIKVSNPIRSKQLTKPTVWNDMVSINQDVSRMPEFMWINNTVGDNTIYFQVISDSNNNLLSGTYTFQNTFQYYNTSNVVLNITTQTPPSLIVGNNYNFTLMDVSEDNWVNLVIQKTFKAQ